MASRRLFVSVDLAESLHESIAAVQEPFDAIAGVRAVDPTGVHVTLKFLGEVPDERVDHVSGLLTEAVEAAGIDPFDARFGRLGVFPDYDYISVIWVGVPEGGGELARLHEAIEDRFVDAGYEPEDHEFTPHVTVARMDHGGGKERVQELLRTMDPDVGEMRVEQVQLKESTLRADGPVYETVSSVPL